MPDTLTYFAYGSNLWPARMLARVPSAEFLAPYRVHGFRLTFSKLGADGSAKADIHFTGENSDVVYGVAYRMATKDRPGLDEIEGGYHHATLLVEGDDTELRALTYIASQPLDQPPAPFDWYRDLVLEGARFHGFPASYLADIRRVSVVCDPDVARRARNRY